MGSTSTVYIVDDDRAVLDSVAMLLTTDNYTVRVHDSARTFLSDIGQDENGCVIADVRMPEMGGIELLAILRERGVPLPVIIITGHADVPLAVEAMRQGAVDFLEKPFDGDKLIASVRAALPLDGEDCSASRMLRGRTAGLTKREKEVLTGLLDGKPNKIIAYELGISPRTVEVHRANLMSKTQATSLAELVKISIKQNAGPAQ